MKNSKHHLCVNLIIFYCMEGIVHQNLAIVQENTVEFIKESD